MTSGGHRFGSSATLTFSTNLKDWHIQPYWQDSSTNNVYHQVLAWLLRCITRVEALKLEGRQRILRRDASLASLHQSRQGVGPWNPYRLGSTPFFFEFSLYTNKLEHQNITIWLVAVIEVSWAIADIAVAENKDVMQVRCRCWKNQSKFITHCTIPFSVDIPVPPLLTAGLHVHRWG